MLKVVSVSSVFLLVFLTNAFALTDAQLCVQGTEYLKGEKARVHSRIWGTGDRKAFAIEAQKKGLTCGIRASRQPKNVLCNNLHLYGYQKWVEDNNIRCTPNQIANRYSEKKCKFGQGLSFEMPCYTDYYVCLQLKKLANINWAKGGYDAYLKEATRRGLDCANASLFSKDGDTAKVKPKTKQYPNEVISASSGSGFAVSSDGHIVTNHHVINGCQNVFVHRRGKKFKMNVVSHDQQNDLALLKGNFEPDVILRLTSAKPQLAQDIYVAGYPFGLNISSSVKVTKGIISSLAGAGNNLAEMQIDAALQLGNSGGPILDKYGNVVGVAVAKLDVKFALENFGSIPENTNFGVKANIVEALLDANNVSYQKGKSDKPSAAEFSNIMSNGTYYISCWMTFAQIEEMKTKKVMFSDLQ